MTLLLPTRCAIFTHLDLITVINSGKITVLNAAS